MLDVTQHRTHLQEGGRSITAPEEVIADGGVELDVTEELSLM